MSMGDLVLLNTRTLVGNPKDAVPNARELQLHFRHAWQFSVTLETGASPAETVKQLRILADRIERQEQAL